MQTSILADFVNSYPEVAAIAVLVIGLIIARIVQVAVQRVLTVLDERLALSTRSGEGAISPRMIRFATMISFWLVAAVSLIVALMLLDVARFNIALDSLFSFLGRLLLAIFIVGAGHFLGLTARSAILQFTGLVDPRGPIPWLVHGSILLVAIVTGLTQLDIDTSFITQLLLVLSGISFGALALAFALGARQHVANMLAHSELSRFSVGERIRIGKTEGSIVSIHATGVEIETKEGLAAIPASHFTRVTVLRLTGGDGE